MLRHENQVISTTYTETKSIDPHTENKSFSAPTLKQIQLRTSHKIKSISIPTQKQTQFRLPNKTKSIFSPH